MEDARTDQGRPHGWFEKFVINILRRYASSATADRVFAKYAGLPRDIVAEQYIKQQARVAALAGAVSSAAITGAVLLSGAAVVSTVGIPALAITLPAGIAAFGAEMAYTLRLQVRAAYDLCLLYGVPLDPDDPEDLWNIFLIGLGVKGGESVGRAIQQLVPKITQQQVRRVLRAGLIRRRIQNWFAKNVSREIAARYLAEGFLLKVAVPGVSIALGAGWNYVSTLGIGRGVRSRVRGTGMSIERVNQLELPLDVPPEAILATALNVIATTSRVHENEMAAYRRLGARIQELHPEFDPQALGDTWLDQEQWLSQLATIDGIDEQEAILAVAETMAVLDGRVRRPEATLLKKMCRLFGVKFDRRRLNAQADRFYVRPPGQACRIVALVIGIVLVLALFTCLAGAILLARGWLT